MSEDIQVNGTLDARRRKGPCAVSQSSWEADEFETSSSKGEPDIQAYSKEQHRMQIFP